MGGAISVPGNITPAAEFNTYADSIAAARVFALTSPYPLSTLPPPAPTSTDPQPLYPRKLSRTLRLTLMPLDITTPHLLHRSAFTSKVTPLIESGSPLAEWVSAFVSSTFHKISTLHEPPATNGDIDAVPDIALNLHDPLCIWYVLSRESAWKFSHNAPEDIRIETSGQWTRGMCVIDRRDRLKLGDNIAGDAEAGQEGIEQGTGGEQHEPDSKKGESQAGDDGGWLNPARGNRIYRVVGSPSPGVEGFGMVLLERVFG